MAIAPPSPDLRKFLDSLEGFLQNPPRDLPEGAVQTMTDLRGTLKGYTAAEEPSPGEKELVKAAGSDEPVPYTHAAKGEDGPSPGQQEYAKVQEAAQALANAAGGLGTSNTTA